MNLYYEHFLAYVSNCSSEVQRDEDLDKEHALFSLFPTLSFICFNKKILTYDVII